METSGKYPNVLHDLSPAAKGTLLITAITVTLYWIYHRLLPKPLPGIAYNPEATKSLFGDAGDLSREMRTTGEFSMWLGRQVEKMGSPVCQVFIQPFQKPWILVSDFCETQDILMRRTEFEKPQFLIDGMQGLGDFHARYKTNDKFRARRQLRQDLMTPSFLNNNMGPLIYTKALEVVQLFKMKSDMAKSRPFNIRSDFWHASLDVMLFYAFGEDINESALSPQLEAMSSLDPSSVSQGTDDDPVDFPEAPLSEFLDAVQEAPNVLERTTVSITPKLSYWWWSHQDWHKKIYAQKDMVLPQQLRKAAENCENNYIKSALDHIMMREKALARKQGRQPQLVTQSMADEIFSDLLSGHHTTGGAMGWITKFLTGYQHTQKKLREALYMACPDAVAENRNPTFEELRGVRIPYLEAVIEESRRLTPFSIVRETTQETEILGRRIPKGAQVFMVTGGPNYLSPSVPVDEETRSPTSRNSKIKSKWDESKDLKIFEPERWLITREDGTIEFDGASGPQLGFGMGIRQCWGRRLAHLAIRTVIAMVIWNFELNEIPEELAGYAGHDGISRQPQRAFVRMQRVTPYAPRMR